MSPTSSNSFRPQIPWLALAGLVLAVVSAEFLVHWGLVTLGTGGMPHSEEVVIDATSVGVCAAVLSWLVLVAPAMRRENRLRQLSQRVSARVESALEGDLGPEIVRTLVEEWGASGGYFAVRSGEGLVAPSYVWSGGRALDLAPFPIAGTMWERLADRELAFEEEEASRVFRRDPLVASAGLGGAVGFAVRDGSRALRGVLVVAGVEAGGMDTLLILGRHLASRLSESMMRRDAEQDSSRARRRNAQLLQLLDSAAMVSSMDSEGLTTYANAQLCQATGCTLVGMMGREHLLRSSGDPPASDWEAIQSAIREGRTWRAEVRHWRRDGRPLWLHTTVRGMLDDAGRLEQILCLCFDATELRMAEGKAGLLARAAQSVSDGLCVVNPAGQVVETNDAFWEVLGLRAGPLGVSLLELVVDRPEAETLARAMESAGPAVVCARMRFGNRGAVVALPVVGQAAGAAPEPPSFWAEVRVDPIRGPGGALSVVSIRDVTERVRLEHGLRAEAEIAVFERDVSVVLSEGSRSIRDRLTTLLTRLLSMDVLRVRREAGIFVLADGALRLAATVGDVGEDFLRDDAVVPLGGCLCGRAALEDARNGASVLISDECPCRPRHGGPCGGVTHGLLVVPLFSEVGCEGVLFLTTEPHPARDPEALEVLERAGRALGGALRGLGLHDVNGDEAGVSLERAIDSVRAEVERSASIASGARRGRMEPGPADGAAAGNV
ncbi:MAG: PAS domain S-box protein [Phycisphaerales bacterium]|nr:PAS domain S-box protein [Phycisphaerales bacterium]